MRVTSFGVPNSYNLRPAAGPPAPQPPGAPQDKFEPQDPQDGCTHGKTYAKYGMAASVIGGCAVGGYYGGILGLVIGGIAGSGMATMIENKTPENSCEKGKPLMAAGAGLACMAVGGHFGGILGLFIGGVAAEGMTQFIME